jgi:DNA-binding transcriptional LysR family regulator
MLSVRTAAISGAGIVLQPEDLLADDIAQGRLQRVLGDWSYKETPMNLIYRQDTFPTAKLRSVIDFILNEFPPAP